MSYFNARYYDGKRGQFLSEDPVFWEVGQTQDGKSVLANPQAMNSYSYAGNNPIINKDPQGRFLDTVLDVGFIGYDLYQLGHAVVTGGDVKGELGYLGLDLAGAVIPGVTGLGVVARTARVVSKGETVNNTIKVAEGLKLGESFGKAGTVVENTSAKITGFLRSYAKDPYHGLDQVITRGVSPKLLVDTVKNPLVTLKQAGGNVLRLTEKAGVVLDRAGKVATTYTTQQFLPHIINILKKVTKK